MWPNYFLEGMLAFGVTQVIYISAFEMKPLNLDLGVILYVIAALGKRKGIEILIRHDVTTNNS